MHRIALTASPIPSVVPLPSILPRKPSCTDSLLFKKTLESTTNPFLSKFQPYFILDHTSSSIHNCATSPSTSSAGHRLHPINVNNLSRTILCTSRSISISVRNPRLPFAHLFWRVRQPRPALPTIAIVSEMVPPSRASSPMPVIFPTNNPD